jgi:DNA (cytosine-5)-methyltransferase 1
VATKIGHIDVLLASPECTSHSVAKGKAPGCEKSRETAFQVVRYASVFRPRWIVVENVTRMRTWPRFDEWLKAIEKLDYKTCVAVIDSKDHRTPQSRRRLFILCDLESTPTPPPKSPGPRRTVASILMSGTDEKEWPFRPLQKGIQAEATHERAQRAIAQLGSNSEFIIVYYGTDGAGGFQSIDRPLRTVTTLDRFAYVRPSSSGHEMRMLQPPELAAAMGFPGNHSWPGISRRDQIKLIGNAVCPPVMCDVVRHLTRSAVLADADPASGRR